MTVFEGMVGGSPTTNLSNYVGDVGLASSDGDSGFNAIDGAADVYSSGEVSITAPRIKIAGTTVPATSSDIIATSGYIAMDSSYIYVSVDVDSWKRIPLSSF